MNQEEVKNWNKEQGYVDIDDSQFVKDIRKETKDKIINELKDMIKINVDKIKELEKRLAIAEKRIFVLQSKN